MAHTEHLPIYKAAYDLCLWLEQVVRGLPRHHEPQDSAASSRECARVASRSTTMPG